MVLLVEKLIISLQVWRANEKVKSQLHASDRSCSGFPSSSRPAAPLIGQEVQRDHMFTGNEEAL